MRGNFFLIAYIIVHLKETNILKQSLTWMYWLFSITNAVKTSGALRERLFNAAYNAKKQALLSGKAFCHLNYFCIIT